MIQVKGGNAEDLRSASWLRCGFAKLDEEGLTFLGRLALALEASWVALAGPPRGEG
jgi:hypothetical protein